MPNEFNGLTYIETEFTFRKSDGTFGFNRLLEIPNFSSIGCREAYFPDVFGSDEVFEQYQKVIKELEEAGYQRKTVESSRYIRTPQFYRLHDDPLGGRYL